MTPSRNNMTLLEQRIQAVATRPRITPRGTVFPRSDYIYTVVPTSLKYMLDDDGAVIEESDSGGDAAVLYVYEADAYYKRASQEPLDDTQDPDKPIFTKDRDQKKDGIKGIYRAASEIRLVSPVLLTLGEDVAAVNRGTYFEVISVLDKRPAPWTLVPKLTPGSYRIYIPYGSLILYLISAVHDASPLHSVMIGDRIVHAAEPNHIVDVGRGVVTIDLPEDAFGNEWYTVGLSAGSVYVSIEKGVVKVTNDQSKYSSRIAVITSGDPNTIEQIASSTITLLIEEDSPDAPEKDETLEDPPPCGHPGNEPYEWPEDGEGHPFDEIDVPDTGDSDHPGDNPSPPSSGECE